MSEEEIVKGYFIKSKYLGKRDQTDFMNNFSSDESNDQEPIDNYKYKEINVKDFTKKKYNGKGIRYWQNGQRQYEGDYKNSIRHGNGIDCYSTGKTYYEGDFRNGQVEGKGV